MDTPCDIATNITWINTMGFDSICDNNVDTKSYSILGYICGFEEYSKKPSPWRTLVIYPTKGDLHKNFSISLFQSDRMGYNVFFFDMTAIFITSHVFDGSFACEMSKLQPTIILNWKCSISGKGMKYTWIHVIFTWTCAKHLKWQQNNNNAHTNK